MAKNSVRKSVWLRDLIEACPLLSDYEKSLLVQIDLEGKSVTEVAKSMSLVLFSLSISDSINTVCN